MKKTLITTLASLPMLVLAANDQSFSSGIQILEPSEIINEKSLDFSASIRGRYQEVTVEPNDLGAAIFKAKGAPYGEVRGYIREHSIQIVHGDGYHYGDWITVSNFKTGGGLSVDGYGQFNSKGLIENIRVGGTAYINSYNVSGSYIGTATFRITNI